MPNAESAIQKAMEQQDTGNHKAPGAVDQNGADRFGGTRTGAQNVEGSAERGRLLGGRAGGDVPSPPDPPS